MKLKQIINLKSKYLISKVSLIMLIMCAVLLILASAFSFFNIDNYMSYDEKKEELFINIFSITKYIITILGVYLFIYGITFKNDFLYYLLAPLKVSRVKAIMVTIVINVILCSILYLLSYGIFLLFGYFLKGFYLKVDYIYAFFLSFLITLFYSFLGMLVMQAFKNYFSLLVVVTLFILSNNIAGQINNDLSKYVLIILPNTNEFGLYIAPWWYLVILVIFLCFINVIIYNEKDLNW